MERTWTPRGDDPDTHDLHIDAQTHGYVSRYRKYTSGYNWQAQRGESLDMRAVGDAPPLEAAMREAERHLDMPIGEFNAIVALKLIKERDELNATLAQLGVDGAAGEDRYQAGYVDGFEAARQAILDALDARRARVPS